MLYLPLSKGVDSSETVVAPGAMITAEGLALVRAPGLPASGVMPSMAANANEIFAGFSIAGVSAAPYPLAYNTKVESFIVPASGIVTLTFAPVTDQVFVFDVTAGEAVASPTVAGLNITGLTPTDVVNVTYRYSLSVIQARVLQGDTQPGGYVGDYVGQVGLVKRGLIYTSEFDASVDWAAATAIKLAPNGQVTDQTGTGAAINGYVVAVPGVEVPYLGLEFSAA